MLTTVGHIEGAVKWSDAYQTTDSSSLSPPALHNHNSNTYHEVSTRHISTCPQAILFLLISSHRAHRTSLLFTRAWHLHGFTGLNKEWRGSDAVIIFLNDEHIAFYIIEEIYSL
jgi:CRISPR/Cas system CMR subunit Cmr6 (Cas7 group RAMP superfamily)